MRCDIKNAVNIVEMRRLLLRLQRSALRSRHLLAHDERRKRENLSDTRLNARGKEKKEGWGAIAFKKSGCGDVYHSRIVRDQ